VLRVLRSRELNDLINRRSNKRLNATAHSVALINLVRGGALSAALEPLQTKERKSGRASRISGSRELSGQISRRSNKRMHATALQHASHVRRAGRRVMRSVMLLLQVSLENA
jgi:hypothetical protein